MNMCGAPQIRYQVMMNLVDATLFEKNVEPYSYVIGETWVHDKTVLSSFMLHCRLLCSTVVLPDQLV